MAGVKRHRLYQIYRFEHVHPALTSIWGTHGQEKIFKDGSKGRESG